MPARPAVEEKQIRFHNAVHDHDVLVAAEFARVRNRFHGAATRVPSSRRERCHPGHIGRVTSMGSVFGGIPEGSEEAQGDEEAVEKP